MSGGPEHCGGLFGGRSVGLPQAGSADRTLEAVGCSCWLLRLAWVGWRHPRCLACWWNIRKMFHRKRILLLTNFENVQQKKLDRSLSLVVGELRTQRTMKFTISIHWDCKTIKSYLVYSPQYFKVVNSILPSLLSISMVVHLSPFQGLDVANTTQNNLNKRSWVRSLSSQERQNDNAMAPLVRIGKGDRSLSVFSLCFKFQLVCLHMFCFKLHFLSKSIIFSFTTFHHHEFSLQLLAKKIKLTKDGKTQWT